METEHRCGLTLTPGQLVGTVCRAAGVACPLLDATHSATAMAATQRDPTVPIRLLTDADRVPHYSRLTAADRQRLRQSALDRKRDLDVLQRLGLANGDTRGARYLYALLFERVATTAGLCGHDTPGWSGCPHARSGAYERVRAKGWPQLVRLRPPAEKDAARALSAARVATGGKLHLRPHHLMCLSCWLAGRDPGDELRGEDTLAEIYQRLRRDPTVPVVLVEGQCEACWCCDGFHEPTGGCVHDCGQIRDLKKDLDLFCRLGLLPGDELPAGELLARIYAAVPTTTAICGYGDGLVQSREWSICGGPEGNAGYQRTRETGAGLG